MSFRVSSKRNYKSNFRKNFRRNDEKKNILDLNSNDLNQKTYINERVSLVGKISTDITYDLILGKKHKSIAKFNVDLKYGTGVIKCFAFDDEADMLYREGEIGKLMYIEGKLINSSNLKTSVFEANYVVFSKDN